MTQDNREFNDMNSAFEKLRIASDESDKNMSDELDILKPKILQTIDQIREKKKCPDTNYYGFIARSCATSISKGLMELVIEELITQNVIFKKTVQGLDSFYKLNEKEVPIPTANSFIEIFETQPNASDNEILETLEEESRGFDKTPSIAIIDIQISALPKSLSENLEAPQDIRKIRAQISVPKSHVMCEFSELD